MLRERFKLDGVVLVGNRGITNNAHIEADLKRAGLDWATALQPQSRPLRTRATHYSLPYWIPAP